MFPLSLPGFIQQLKLEKNHCEKKHSDFMAWAVYVNGPKMLGVDEYWSKVTLYA